VPSARLLLSYLTVGLPRPTKLRRSSTLRLSLVARATDRLTRVRSRCCAQVPYLRIPLVVSFFATDDRIHALASTKLQLLLDAALFQPGHHLPLDAAGREPVDVPTSAPTLLGTAHHLLLNELCRSPLTLTNAVLGLAKQAIDLDTGSFESSTTTIILYAARPPSTTASALRHFYPPR
jgi:hypothetical protein